MPIATTNPTTGEVVRTFDEFTDDDVEAALARATDTFQSYRHTTFAQRAQWMRVAADLLEAEADQIAATMTVEMGKTRASAKAEALKSARGFRYYADHAEDFLAPVEVEPSQVGAVRAYTVYQPLGPVLAVMPWNFPLWQVVRFAAPALMAGNVGLLKHASNVPQCALYLESLLTRAGFPKGAFQTLLIGSAAVSRVLEDPRVTAATLTGSGPAGSAVAATAGARIKPTVLELGGSDPFVVMPSADLAAAARVAAIARCQNNGQSCIAAKRFIVHTDVADEFQRLFATALSGLVVGDPMAEGTDIGPLATEAGRGDVEELLADAVAKGATVILGGTRVDGPGWFFPPTLVTGITSDMRMYYEEVFGPVASVFRVGSIAEAITVANDSEFGLGSNAWTTDAAEQEQFVSELAAGMVFINGMTTSYNELPFGGIKTSGYGRELSAVGIRAFANLKTVWVGASATPTARAGSHSE